PGLRLGAVTPGEVRRGEEEDRRRADVLLVARLRAARPRDRSVALALAPEGKGAPELHAVELALRVAPRPGDALARQACGDAALRTPQELRDGRPVALPERDIRTDRVAEHLPDDFGRLAVEERAGRSHVAHPDLPACELEPLPVGPPGRLAAGLGDQRVRGLTVAGRREGADEEQRPPGVARRGLVSGPRGRPPARARPRRGWTGARREPSPWDRPVARHRAARRGFDPRSCSGSRGSPAAGRRSGPGTGPRPPRPGRRAG